MNTPASSPKKFGRQLLAAMVAAGLSGSGVFAQVDGIWNYDGAGIWGDEARWLNGDIADGVGATADFSAVNLTANRTITLDTARTIGALLIGDNTGPSFSSYTIGATAGPVLTFDNNGVGAAITQRVDSGANTIAAPLSLADNLVVANASGATLTLSGAVGAATAGTKTITNSGTGAGGVTISGVIGNGVGAVAVVQDSATSQLTLGGANTFTGGVFIKQGTLGAQSSATALGGGTVFLGDTSGNKDATLQLLGSLNYVNPITVQAGGSGNLTIAAGALNKAVLSGPITLNNNLTLAMTAPGGTSGVSTTSTLPYLTVSGDIGGTGDLNLNLTGNAITSNAGGSPQSSSYTLSGAINTTGALNDVSTGTGWKTISGSISSISSLNQNAANSMLILSGANTYSGPTNVNAGVLRLGSLNALPDGNVVNVASGGTLQLSTNSATAFGGTATVNLSGHGTAYGVGALEATNNAHYAGAIVLLADATVASGLATNTLTLSGVITGAHDLTVGGIGNTAISGAINLGTGGLTKSGTGMLTLSSANSYAGATTLAQGVLALANANALGGGGAITFNGGALRLSATNEADYGARIVNSTGPVSIDTNGRTATYSGIDASNTGGLAKLGAGRLTLSGSNAFSGPVAVNAGVLAVSAASALPTSGAGQIFIDSSGALNVGGAYAGAQGWLDSGNISTGSTGALALTGNSSENIDFTGYDSLSLGASTTSTYTGTITPSGTTYRLGGGGSTLALSGVNALTGANGLVVNGPVSLTASNNLSGPTAVNSGTLTLGGAGTLAGSAVTVASGSTLALTTATSGSTVTRVASLELDRGTLTVAGNATANSTDSIAGALAIGSAGHSLVTLTPNVGRHTLLTAGSFTREAGSTALIRGTGLGVNTLASATGGAANISFGTAPTLVGGDGTNTTDRGILVGVVGDTASNGIGFAATGGLLTYDSGVGSGNGLRLLGASEYKTSITSGQTQLDNIKLSQTAAGTATTSLAADTTINSLSIHTSGATGATVSVGGAGKLTLNSGVIYANSVTATTAATVSNTLDFNGREAVILAGGSNNLVLSGALTNTGGNGITVYAPSRTVTLSGAAANTYTGTTTVNGGTLSLGKTAGVNAIAGNLTINTGGIVSHAANDQIADGANVTVNGGTFSFRTDTINSLTASNGGSVVPNATGNLTVTNNVTLSGGASLTNIAAGRVDVGGALNLSGGATVSIKRSQNITGLHDSVVSVGALNITHMATGAYTPIAIDHGVSVAQSGGKLVLGGDVTFVGNATNTNTVLIDAIKGTGRQGVIALTTAVGDRAFDIGNGAAAVDLRITAALQNGDSGPSGLVKSGLGTLELSGAGTYTGSTTVNAGTLLLGGSDRIADTSNLVLGGGTFATGGFSDTLGTLALGASSFIDFGAGSSALVFADSSAVSWTNSVSLTLLNFTEGLDSIRFGTTSAGLSGLQLGQITINGLTAGIDANGYLFASAIPEPSAFAAFAGAAGLLAATARRRRRSA